MISSRTGPEAQPFGQKDIKIIIIITIIIIIK